MNPEDNPLLPLDARPLQLRSIGACEPIDTTRRVVEERDIFRCFWVIRYRDGRIRQQYERRGDTIFQNLFGRLSHAGIAEVAVFDFLSGQQIVAIPVPDDAEVDILSTVSLAFHDTGIEEKRIYTFGWRSPTECLYWHCDPVNLSAWRDKSRES